MLQAHSRDLLLAGSLALAVLLTGCQTKASTTASNEIPLPSVSVITVEAEDAEIYRDYAAQTFARDMVEVRGRVDGYIEKRLFDVGSNVSAGQALYLLDVRPYEAAVAKARGDLAETEANRDFAAKQVGLLQAEADLAQAEANHLKARQDVERLKPLVKQDAAPQQDLDNAVAALQASEANVKAKQANVEQSRLSTKAQIDTTAAKVEADKAMLRTAELDLDYAVIRAPISGRIGESLVQPGGLVTRGATQPLTTIVPLDPIWVRFKVSEAEYITFVERWMKEKAGLPVELELADSAVYPHPGRLQNVLNQVDSKTGTLEVQANFPNPQHRILPGQFGRVRIRTDEQKKALLVPQRAVQELQGLQSVMVVDSGNKVLAKSVVTGDRIGQRWIIRQGLERGDRVIVEGLQKAAPGSIVNPKPFNPDASSKEQ